MKIEHGSSQAEKYRDGGKVISAYCDGCGKFAEFRADSAQTADQEGEHFMWFEIICNECSLILQGFAFGDGVPNGVMKRD